MYPKLTFGVELEFAIASGPAVRLTDSKLGVNPSGEAERAIATQLVKQTTLPVACDLKCGYRQDVTHCPDNFTVYRAALPDPNPGPHQYFLVSQEQGCAPYNARGEYTGVEISSAKADFQEHSRGLPQIRQVVAALRNMDAGIVVGDECGMHIHVGMNEPGGLDLMTVKRVITLVSILEIPLLMNCLISEHRWQMVWACAVTSRSAMYKQPQGFKKQWNVDTARPVGKVVPEIFSDAVLCSPGWRRWCRNLTGLLEAVWLCPSMELLEEGLLTDCEYQERCLLALRCRPDAAGMVENSASTFEFRYPEMSFDIDFISLWVELVTRVVTICKREPDLFASVIKQAVTALGNVPEVPQSGEDYHTCRAALLASIGLGHRSADWAQFHDEHNVRIDKSLVGMAETRSLRA